MTDIKTVRDALHLAEKKCFDATCKIDLELSKAVTQALTALDRIEAVETVTVEVCPAWFEDLASDFGVQRTEAANFLDAICRAYPSITKEK